MKNNDLNVENLSENDLLQTDGGWIALVGVSIATYLVLTHYAHENHH